MKNGLAWSLFAFILVLVCASTGFAVSNEVEVLDPVRNGDPGRASEVWVRLWNNDGSFHLWVINGRRLHCLYRPRGHSSAKGWPASTVFKGYVVEC